MPNLKQIAHRDSLARKREARNKRRRERYAAEKAEAERLQAATRSAEGKLGLEEGELDGTLRELYETPDDAADGEAQFVGWRFHRDGFSFEVVNNNTYGLYLLDGEGERDRYIRRPADLVA